MPTISTDLIVNKNKFSDAKFVETELPDAAELGAGQALLKVDEFAFTANNVTYAVAGESFGYWDFFPAEEGWGRIPVWGFADVIASTAEGLAVGERLYGYLPMSTHLLIEPGHMTNHSLMDMAAHRQERAPIYNQYTLTRTDGAYKKDQEALISLFRPLFTTSFLLDDFHAENDFFGAKSAILSSASSKTSIGLAYLLANRKGQVQVVGLTGKSNIPFVESLGCYDQVLAYEDIETLSKTSTAFVDMAGNAEVLARVHRHFADDLKNSCTVGVTHWDAPSGGGAELPGPKPEVFFAPGYAQARMKEWGGDGFQARIGKVWSDFLPSAEGWITVKKSRGPDAVMGVYQESLANTINPSEGHILSVWS